MSDGTTMQFSGKLYYALAAEAEKRQTTVAAIVRAVMRKIIADGEMVAMLGDTDLSIDGHRAPQAKRPYGKRRVPPKKFLLNGEEKTLNQLSEMSGVGRSTIQWRLASGLTVEQAITTEHYVRYSPRRKTFKQIAEEHGMSEQTLRRRMKSGLTKEAALAMPVDQKLARRA